jgi:hypothetical protein
MHFYTLPGRIDFLLPFRVTRLGEIFAYWAIVFLGHFLNDKSSPKLRLLFSMEKKFCTNFEKMSWATFWAIFSQSHLVSLLPFFRLYKQNGLN